MNIAILLSGGTGSRIGAKLPKQYMEAGGRMLIGYSMERIMKHPLIEAVQVVAAKEWRERICEECREQNYDIERLKGFTESGTNRQMSIFNALRDILVYAREDDHVLIHDAVRPLVTEEQITACLEALTDYEGVMPVLHVKDTMYQISEDGTCISALLDRSRLAAGQAPEGYHLGKYYRANQRLLPDKILQVNGSTEPAVMAGMKVRIISGIESNYKITTPDDLERFRQSVGNP